MPTELGGTLEQIHNDYRFDHEHAESNDQVTTPQHVVDKSSSSRKEMDRSEEMRIKSTASRSSEKPELASHNLAQFVQSKPRNKKRPSK